MAIGNSDWRTKGAGKRDQRQTGLGQYSYLYSGWKIVKPTNIKFKIVKPAFEVK